MDASTKPLLPGWKFRRTNDGAILIEHEISANETELYEVAHPVEQRTVAAGVLYRLASALADAGAA